MNPEQQKAVETVQGRVLILAGAGSGKTTVLTRRMAHLIQTHGVPASSILGLTFTNKAAGEMRSRIGSFVTPSQANEITLCTFHSFCHKVLRADIERLGFTPHFSIYDENDIQRVVGVIARDLLGHEGELPSMTETFKAISSARNKGLKAEDISGTGSEWHDKFTQQVYKRLQDSLRAHNALDFDSLLSLTVELFEKHSDVLQRYQDRFRYIMIDEYQDTNPIQCRLAKLLSSKYGNLCVVGDDDQSIYGWRGAEVKNILQFEGATTIKLEQNYRSSNTILQAANAVISNNPNRHPKKLWSTMGEGERIAVFHTATEIEEAEAVAFRLSHFKEKMGLRWKDMAVLYRSNALSRQFEIAFLKYNWKDGDRWIRGIPYQVFGGLEFYERREVKDLIAYLRVVANPLDQEALLRIINQPRRGIGDTSLDAITIYNRSHGIPLWNVLEGLSNEGFPNLAEGLPLKARQGIKSFVSVIKKAKEDFSQPSWADALKILVTNIDYEKALYDEVKNSSVFEAKWDNVQELVTALEEFAVGQQTPSLQEFLSNSVLNNSNDHEKKKGLESDAVSLMTFHSAKGLEFTACFLVGLEDHIIPHERSLEETGLDEERRLMYVAITRAKKFLTISMARNRKRFGQDASSKPSRFLKEIPKELIRPVAPDQI